MNQYLDSLKADFPNYLWMIISLMADFYNDLLAHHQSGSASDSPFVNLRDFHFFLPVVCQVFFSFLME